jgi:hypothetical protein
MPFGVSLTRSEPDDSQLGRRTCAYASDSLRSCCLTFLFLKFLTASFTNEHQGSFIIILDFGFLLTSHTVSNSPEFTRIVFESIVLDAF